MGLFDSNDDEVQLENAELDCKPQNDFVSPEQVKPIDDKLDPGERVHFVFTGRSGLQIDGDKKSATGKSRTVITDRRVLLKVESGPLLAGHEYHNFHYQDISSVSKAEGLVNVRLDVETSSKTYGVHLSQASLSEGVGDEAVEFIRERMQETKSQKRGDDNSSKDPIEQIERLKKLKEDGAISAEEFDQKKQELLDHI